MFNKKKGTIVIPPTVETRGFPRDIYIMMITWIIVLLAAALILMCIRVRNKNAFWDSVRVGDIVVGSGIGGYHIREMVLEKTEDRITLSESGTMSRGKFLYGGELEYFSSEDWYSFNV